MVSTPLVSVIVVHYRHQAATAACLTSIHTQTYPNWEVLVVDNGSEDPRLDRLANERVKVLRAGSNLGYAGGNNLGIQAARGELLLFLNNDARLPDTWLEKMVAAWQTHPRLGLLSSCITYLDRPGILQYAGYTEVTTFTGRNKLPGAGQPWQPEERLTPTAYAHGSGMLSSREVIERVGPIPNRYFLYYEELDWSRRIRDLGYDILVYHGMAMEHHGSLSLGRGSPRHLYYYHRSRLIFQRSWLAPVPRAIFLLYYLAIAAPKEVLRLLARRQFRHLRAWRDAMWWHLRYAARLPEQAGPWRHQDLYGDS